MAAAASAGKIEVEAFNIKLHGCKILCQGPFFGKYPPILEAVEKLREPFKRRILISRTPFSFSKALPLQYDATFQVRETVDWSLILTYVAYSPKPLLVIAEDVEIPDAVWAKISAATTFVHITQTPIRNIRAYDAVFFAPVGGEVEAGAAGFGAGGYADYVFRQIQMLYKGNYTQAEYKEIIAELRVAGAGLAYTGGSMYWYDIVATQGSDTLSRKQLSELFAWLSSQFS
jgi:hypothetical protein